MTLLLPMINRDQAVVVADRRLSRKGRVRTEEWTKLLTFVTDDARVAVGICGLAQINQGKPAKPGRPPKPGDFDASFWLMDALLECARADHRLLPTLERLRAKATNDICGLGAPLEVRRLTVVFAGYLYAEGSPRPCFHNLTNFDRMGQWPQKNAFAEFELEPHFGPRADEDGEPVLFASFGGDGVLTSADRDSCIELLRERRPTEAYVQKGIDVIKRAADYPASQGRIGKQIRAS